MWVKLFFNFRHFLPAACFEIKKSELNFFVVNRQKNSRANIWFENSVKLWKSVDTENWVGKIVKKEMQNFFLLNKWRNKIEFDVKEKKTWKKVNNQNRKWSVVFIARGGLRTIFSVYYLFCLWFSFMFCVYMYCLNEVISTERRRIHPCFSFCSLIIYSFPLEFYYCAFIWFDSN